MNLANLLCVSQAAITTPPTATMKQTTIYPRSTSSWLFRARGSRRDTRTLRIPPSISKRLFLTQVEAVLVRTSLDQMMVWATAKALEVCASALYHHGRQFPDNMQTDW